MNKTILLTILLSVVFNAYCEDGCINESIKITGVEKIEELSELSNSSSHISILRAETQKLSIDYRCELYHSWYDFYENELRDVKTGTLTLEDNEMEGITEMLSFENYEDFCMRLIRWEYLDDVRFIKYECKDDKK